MVATVRLDEAHEKLLNEMAEKLRCKKSDVLRRALDFYAGQVLHERKRRMESAVMKVCRADHKEVETLEGTVGDGLSV
ncbi:MAG: ribbon-helix-helix protein, CopG family [Epsilonproteobacteria bacterium]|nr:ribbon-helix-helix protein, CopG family [Campylobacterota bacterium]